MEGHSLRALAVLDNGELVGTVTLETLAGQPDFSAVGAAAIHADLVLEGDMTVREASEEFVKRDVEFAPVMLDGSYLGIVTSNMLLQELGRSWDPLTGLSWSDQLREWGIENLRRGNEITILFIDLDDFGQYNKRFGHIVGDHVLQRVAGMLSESINPETDILVRYGGDEFAIGTVRERSDADELAAILKRKAGEVFIGEAEDTVDFTIGIQGGKRSKERDSIHYAATLDNLINLASKDCIAQKSARQSIAEREMPPVAAVELPIPQEPPTSLRVVSVFADDHTSNSLTQVIISVGDAVVSGVSSRMGKSVIESIAQATAKGLERKFPDRVMTVNDIHLTQSGDGQRLVTVSAQVATGDQSIAVGGVKMVEQDLYTDVAVATLQAFQQAKIPEPES